MSARSGGEPQRKRLKQTSIEESFSRYRSILKSQLSPHLSETKETSAPEVMQRSISPKEELRKKRSLLADAAEKRRGSTSNTAGTSATSTTSSEIVVEGNSKNGILSDNEDSLGFEFDDSPPLFPDSPLPAPPPDELPATKTRQCFVSGGTPLQSVNRIPDCSPPLPPLLAQPDHTVLVRPSISGDFAVPPVPSHVNYRDKWDKNHVRMPCSSENLYPGQNSEKKIQNRWELIEATLLGPIASSLELQDAILKYNAHYSKRWNFEALHSYFNEVLDVAARKEFFNQTLPAMVTLALRLPSLCTQAIPLLKRQQNHSLTLSQEQVACLLANAFFCTFPRRNSCKHSEYSTFPDINFNRLFQGGKGGTNSVKTEKLQAIFHYFRRVTKQMPTGTLTFQRQIVKSGDMPAWERCSASFGKIHVSTKGTIEDNGIGFLQVDFANKYIGGGVIGEGCVQEEIRFLICPELILSRLFTERLDDNECVFITGAERFSDYVGYAHTFRWAGNHVDQATRDSWGRRCSRIVAIDANIFRCYTDQFEVGLLKRELDKAYCGFYSPVEQRHLPAIATGNWGCGAFGGDPRVKGLIQMMASGACSRDLVYFTFGDDELAGDLLNIHSFVTERKLTVGDVWTVMMRYGKEIRAASSVTVKLYPFMRELQDKYECDTDDEVATGLGESDATLVYTLEPDSDSYKDNTP
ncbi:poly(ADP-ribose) glycohydrolase-like isoform X1 [Montipora capricornis]|uniref:poly(ADP-ribose) glycohydrolase-like isoform X1 n=1 Tax=Montipora capricornis TaxID=246305 RepID=UPI0035F21130